MSDRRLSPQPGEVIDRTSPRSFTWNGRAMSGLAGDTVVSALAASGVRVFSRSLKYHRRRGVLTADYHDPNTMLQIGDEPNVRAGHRLLDAGMVVSSQNTWPSLRFDMKAANRLVGRFLAPGFYYKTFISPRPAWPLYQRVLRRFAHGGRVDPETHGAFDKRHAHPDVLVAGGGPAGMAAALGAAEVGAEVMLVDEQHELGGHLRWGGELARAAMAELRAEVEAHASIEVLTDSVVAGRYDHNWVMVHQRSHPLVDERLIKVRAKALVVAAGTIERPYVFEGNDLPGVMLSGAVRRLINLYAVKPGDRAVVFGANAALEAAVEDLERTGVEIAAVADARRGGRLIRAAGRGRLASVELDSGRHQADLLVTAAGWTTPTSLLNMAGSRPVYHPEAARFLPGELPDDVHATGGLVGDGSTEELVAHGRAIGIHATAGALATRRRWQALTPGALPLEPAAEVPAEVVPDLVAAHHPELYRSSTHGFVDYSEDVSSKDLHSAVAEGYDLMELDKRFTTVTMGPVQGKLEVGNAVAVHAEATGRSIEATGTTTWRPPYAPVSLGALAGAHLEPVRYSPIQAWHEANGAVPIVAGQWIRPEHYGDPAAEVRAVRDAVGIIDVSPLGKIDLRGTDVPALLDFLYTNRWASLAVGSVRYGVMCGEDGVVMDDGVVGRLGDDHYLMTTTSGGAGRVWNWIEDWLQTGFPDLDVTMTAVTDGYASINVAGPRSRELLGGLTDIDLDPEAFGYMRVRTGAVAGIDGCIVWRIGFTGELSYEVHVPSGFALSLWEALLEAGADFGIAPFGLEAQRIMRLEKGHFIVGQDTDGLTKAYTTGLDWAIKLDKDDFAGKPELAWQSETDHPHLVGLQTVDPRVVPDEACQIVEGDRIVGRVTSSRMSPTLGRSVCLAMVDAAQADPGRRVMVRLVSGELAPAVVMDHHAHFDPEGSRLRG